MKSIMKLRSLFFMICIGMMLISGNSYATEDHGQNRELFSISVDDGIAVDFVAMTSTDVVMMNDDLSVDAYSIIESNLSAFKKQSNKHKPIVLLRHKDMRSFDDLRVDLSNYIKYRDALYSPCDLWHNDMRIDNSSLLHIDPGWQF